MFNKLFTRPGYKNKGVLSALMLSDVQKIVHKLKNEFPEFISVGVVGKTFQGRDIPFFTVDARKYLVN